MPKWRANTAYVAGQVVLGGDGLPVSALANFTSGSVYDASKWTPVVQAKTVTVPTGTEFNPPFGGVLMLNRADIGTGVVVGIDSAAELVVDPVNARLGNNRSTLSVPSQQPAPPGTIIDATYAGRAQMVRYNGVYYAVFPSDSAPVSSIWKTSVNSPWSWTKVQDLTTDGTYGGSATSFPTTIDQNGSFIFVGEYGDPKTSGAMSPKIWRSVNGTTWAVVYTGTMRHIHAVACDPYNAGHVYATTGDGNTFA